METLLKKYQAQQELRNLAGLTIKGHQVRIGMFLSELKARGVEIGQVDIEVIRAIIKDRGWQVGTASVWVITIKQFMDFLVAEGAVPKNPISDIKMRSNGGGRYRIFDIPESGQIKLAAKMIGLDGELFVNLLIDTGARIHEVLAIKAANINLGKQSIYLEKTKGGRERYVFFSNETKLMLDRYLPLLPGNILIPYSQGWAREQVKKVLGIAFPNQPDKASITPHGFRHSFVTNWNKRGGNLRALINIIGWKSGAMLNTYDHWNEESLGEAYRDCQNGQGAVGVKGVKCL